MSKTTKRTATKTDGTPRCFGYARVSTERQSNEGHSLADQEQRIRGYAQSAGLTLDGVFVEAGVSGGKRLSHVPRVPNSSQRSVPATMSSPRSWTGASVPRAMP